MTTAEELTAAADYLRKYGWRKYGGVPNNGKCGCMLTALAAVQGLADWVEADVPDALVSVTSKKPWQDRAQAVYNFNDFECKTKRDAIAALEIAADLAS